MSIVDFFIFLLYFCSYSTVQQSVVSVPALLAFHGALWGELALTSPMLL
jgi:hypothetical protein